MSKASDNANYFVTGAGLYFLMSWAFTFYPAFIFGLFLHQILRDSCNYSELWGFITMVIGTVVIICLWLKEQDTAVVIIYVITSWPFWKILKHLWDNAGEMTTYPLPPVDWWPLW